MNSINSIESNHVNFNGWGSSLKGILPLLPKKTSVAGMTAPQKMAAVGAATALAALGVSQQSDNTNKTERSPIELAIKENPELYKALKEKTHDYDWGQGLDNTSTTRNYCDEAIVTIIKYNKEDPDFAYELSKYLEHTGSGQIVELNPEQTELIAQTLKAEPEFMEQFKNYTPYRLSRVLEVRNQVPDFVNIMIEKDSVKCLFEDQRRVDDAIEEFNNNKELMSEIMNNVTCNLYKVLNILPSYIEDKENARKLISMLKSKFDDIPYNYKEIFEYYKKYPEHTINAIKNSKKDCYYGGSDIVSTVREKVSEEQRIAAEEKRFEESKLVAEQSNLTPVLEKVENLDKELRYTLIDNFKSCPNVLDRIIEDGRLPKAMDLKDLYLRNPDKPVTERMVAKELDPMGKFFR